MQTTAAPVYCTKTASRLIRTYTDRHGLKDVVRETVGVDLSKAVIAYEPVWAIGTGLTPTPADVAEVHASLREMLGQLIGAEAQAVRILYGGSVKPGNARELMAVENVDGALVGGASLVADDFLGIAAAYAD